MLKKISDYSGNQVRGEVTPYQCTEAKEKLLGIIKEPETREPWQMTKEEYLKAETVTLGGVTRHLCNKISPCGMPVKAFEIKGSEWYSRNEGDHKWLIKKALKEGKTVPAKVLRDYDLAEAPTT